MSRVSHHEYLSQPLSPFRDASRWTVHSTLTSINTNKRVPSLFKVDLTLSACSSSARRLVVGQTTITAALMTRTTSPTPMTRERTTTTATMTRKWTHLPRLPHRCPSPGHLAPNRFPLRRSRLHLPLSRLNLPRNRLNLHRNRLNLPLSRLKLLRSRLKLPQNQLHLPLNRNHVLRTVGTREISPSFLIFTTKSGVE